MPIYITRDGDVLDDICHRHYGTANGTVERVLEANPGLSNAPPIFERGRAIELPDIPAPESRGIRLFD